MNTHSYLRFLTFSLLLIGSSQILSAQTVRVPTGLAGNSNNGNMGEGIAANNGWADFVFEDDYTLMPVAELEAFIKKYKHLPNVPSAAQVQAEGIDLAEMNAILLRQIEELTLRVIELEKGLVED